MCSPKARRSLIGQSPTSADQSKDHLLRGERFDLFWLERKIFVLCIVFHDCSAGFVQQREQGIERPDLCELHDVAVLMCFHQGIFKKVLGSKEMLK